MDFDLDMGQQIVIALSAALFIWYLGASAINRRRGIALYRWLYRALQELGEVGHTEWIGSSSAGARLLVDKARQPFRSVLAVYLLEPREFLPYWILSRLKGKRDGVVIRCTLRSAPKVTMEVRQEARRRFNLKSREDANKAQEFRKFHKGFMVNIEDGRASHALEGIRNFLEAQGANVKLIIIQRKAPHLEIHARVKPLLQTSPESYLAYLGEWFE